MMCAEFPFCKAERKNILIDGKLQLQLSFICSYILSKQQFIASEVVSGQSVETYKVTYKPYQNGVHQKIPVTPEGMRRNEMFEDLQNEFLGSDESKCFLFRLEISLCEKSIGNHQQKTCWFQ